MVEELISNAVVLIRPRRLSDERGWFCETFSAQTMERLGLPSRFVQDNHSLSRRTGTIRGLHFQKPPHAQAKLVSCVRGRIIDITVDLRRGSPSFGRWAAVELSAQGGEQLFVPIGMAHGFVTLEDDTEVLYKVTDLYAPNCDAGVYWNDPAICIDWRLNTTAVPIVSAKDAALPVLSDLETPFSFDPGDKPLQGIQEIVL
jgi:dTDP-4-dehydrorhamnose 3,5-epimerase